MFRSDDPVWMNCHTVASSLWATSYFLPYIRYSSNLSHVPTEDREAHARPAHILPQEVDVENSEQELSTGSTQGEEGPRGRAGLQLDLPWLNPDYKAARKAMPRIFSQIASQFWKL